MLFLTWGLSALDLFQAAGYNQETILVTSSITLQLTAGSKRSGTEWDGPSLIEPQCSTKFIMYIVKHFPSQRSENSDSTPLSKVSPPPTPTFFFLPQENALGSAF